MAKAKILLVDDDDILREALQKNLLDQGYDVLLAANGKVALTIIASNQVDLVISDIRMPEMDGVELLKAIRSTSSLPVILITGFSEIIETRTAYELGANDFLAKPFQREELLDAIQNCLAPISRITEPETEYCKLGITDFITGTKIKFNIFVLMTGMKYVKIAHKGEDISPERIKFYREKGLQFFYLKKEDFRQYVSFGLGLTKSTGKISSIHKEKKLNLLRYTGEMLSKQIRHDGIDIQTYESAVAFVEATMDILTDNVNAVEVLEALKNHSDYLLAHSIGVSLYSVIIAQALKWTLPTNKFKVAMGGLLHDVGMKEVDTEILDKPRHNWSLHDVKAFEDHPSRGFHILNDLNDIPEDIRNIVRQHHENCLARGYPIRMKKAAIHPMAKLISVADEFCYRVIKNPQSVGLTPMDALQDMMNTCEEQLDKKFFTALIQACRGVPA